MAAPTQTDLASMAFSFGGEPFVLAAKSGIDTDTLAYAFAGNPVVVPQDGGGGPPPPTPGALAGSTMLVVCA